MKLNHLKANILLVGSYLLPILYSGNLYSQSLNHGLKSTISHGDTTTVRKNIEISPDKLLSGRVSGLKVTATSGNPLGAVLTQIRGVNSLRGNTDPLWIIDGAELNRSQLDINAMFWQYADEEYTESANSLINTNPNDIESIEVLKSVAATALYGAKGANGVIIIKTKQASEKTSKINYNSNVIFSNVVRNEPKMLDLTAYRNFVTSLGQNAGTITGNDMNWANQAFDKTRVSHIHNVSVAGTERQFKYYVGAYYKDILGVLDGDRASVGGAQINVDMNVSRTIQIGSRIGGSYTTIDMTKATQMYGMGSSTRSLLSGIPSTGSIYNTWQGWQNDYDDIGSEYRFTSSAFANILLVRNLKLNINGGLDSRNKDRANWHGLNTSFGQKYNGAASASYLNALNFNGNTTISYTNIFADRHNFNALAGIDVWGNNNKLNVINGTNFSIYDLRSKGVQLAESRATPYTFNINNHQLGSFAKLNYDFNKKYGLEASFRLDKASDYEGKYNQYPSVKGFWNIKEESFLKKSNLVSTFLVRSEWGKAGYNRVQPFQLFGNYYTAAAPNINASLAAYHKTFWRLESSEWTAGFDISFWNNRLALSATYYDKTTKDELYLYRYGREVGQAGSWIFDKRSTFLEDKAEVQNKGYEFDLRAHILKLKKLNWYTSVNITVNDNRVKSVSPGTEFGQRVGAFNANYNMAGNRVSSLYGFKANGLITSSNIATAPSLYGQPAQIGDVFYIDSDGNGNIDDQDRQVIGNPTPKLYGGFTSRVDYMKFSLDLTMEGAAGFNLLNLDRMAQTDMSGIYGNIQQEAYLNAGITSPQIGTSNFVSDRFIEKGDYLRLSNVTLSYKMPVGKVKWIKMWSLNLHASNLFTITKYKGFNADVNSFGIDNSRLGIAHGGYPTVRNFGIGLSSTF